MLKQSSTSRRSHPFSAHWLVLTALGGLAWGTTAFGEPAGTWTTVPAQVIRPVARIGHTMATFDGAGWLYGGRTPSAGGAILQTDLWEYKAATGKFSRLNSTTPLPPPRYGHASAASGIFMYTFFGVGEGGALLDDVWSYDDFLHCWELRLPASQVRPAARFEHSAMALPPTQYLVFGGRGGDGSTLLADLWNYNFLLRTWQRLADFPGGGRAGHAMASVGNKMIVLGGTSAAGPQNDVWVYDPQVPGWTQLTSDGEVPGGFTGSTAAAGDFAGTGTPQILLVGGQDGNGMDLGAAYSITVDLGNKLAHWTRVADHSPVFQAAGAAIFRPDGQGSALNFLLFGGSASGTALDTGSVYSTFTAPPPGPDLAGTWLSQKATVKGTGTKMKWTLTGSVQVGNQGTVKTGACSVRFLLSADAVADAGDLLLKTAKAPALVPGKTKSVKLSAKLPTGQTPAGKYVIAVLDALGQVTESSETNNSLASAPF